MEGHQAEVWGLAVSTDGAFVLSGGHDRSLRVWQRTEDMVFLDEVSTVTAISETVAYCSCS
jgi:U3 small nucleolar RNA-associated protein 12